jgi:hypothetical protein
MRKAIDNTPTNECGCVSTKLYLPKRQRGYSFLALVEHSW